MSIGKRIIYGICRTFDVFCRKGFVFVVAEALALTAIAEVGDFSPQEMADFDRAFKTLIGRVIGPPRMCWSDEEAANWKETHPYFIRLNTPTGYVDEVNKLMPTGSCYSVEEVTVALAQCVTNRVFLFRCESGAARLDDEDHPESLYTGNMMLRFEALPPSRSAADRLMPLLFDPSVSDYRSSLSVALIRTMGVGDETTRFIYSVGTNTAIRVGSMPEYAVDLLSIYTNGCDSATSGVVLNATATFAVSEYSSRHFTKWHDLLYLATVPGYERSRMRYDLVTNQVDTASWRRYFRPIKEVLDALQESDFTTPVFSGTPQR